MTHYTWHTTHNTWHTTLDTWHTTHDILHMTHDTRHKTQDTWHKTHDTWHKTQDTRHKTQDTWHMTHDTWHMTHDTWHMTHDTHHKTTSRHWLYMRSIVSRYISATWNLFSFRLGPSSPPSTENSLCTVQYSIVRYSTVQYCTISLVRKLQCHTLQCHTLQYPSKKPSLVPSGSGSVTFFTCHVFYMSRFLHQLLHQLRYNFFWQVGKCYIWLRPYRRGLRFGTYLGWNFSFGLQSRGQNVSKLLFFDTNAQIGSIRSCSNGLKFGMNIGLYMGQILG